MKIGELFVKLGIQTDPQKLKNFEEGVKKVGVGLRNMTLAFSAGLYGMDRFVESSLKGVAALKNFQIQTGLSIDKLQQWQKAGQLSNLALSAESIASSIQSLQENITQMRLSGQGSAGFQALGIDVENLDAFEV